MMSFMTAPLSVQSSQLPSRARNETSRQFDQRALFDSHRDKETMTIGKSPRRLAPTAGALLLLVMMAPPGLAQRAELERRIQRTVLANGLEVIVVQNRGVPLV